MDKLSIAEEIGRAIIDEQHCDYIDDNLDDLEHILNIRRIVAGISEYLKAEGLSTNNIFSLTEDLKTYGRDLFLEIYIPENALMEGRNDIDEEEEGAREEGEYWFNYIFENKKYPE